MTCPGVDFRTASLEALAGFVAGCSVVFGDGMTLVEARLGFPAGVQVAVLKSLAHAPPAWVVVVVAELLASTGVPGDIRALVLSGRNASTGASPARKMSLCSEFKSFVLLL